jgi:S1-C subfamily serine protease
VSEHGSGSGTDHDAHLRGPAGTPATPAVPPAAEVPRPFEGHQSYAASAPQQFAWAPPGHPTQQMAPQAPPYYPGYGGHPVPPVGAPQPAATDERSSRRTGRLRIGIAGLVAGALIGGGAGAGVATLTDGNSAPAATSASAQNVTIQNPETATTATAAAAKAAPSVVTIYVASATTSASGSGVVLTEDGYVVTNNHVVAEAGTDGTVQVRIADGTLYDATVVGTDPASDLAVVKLDGAKNLQPATFADSDKVQVGDVAVAIGAPLGLSNTVTDGIISATDRAVATGSTQNDATVIDALQTDAAINPGNSGGALVNGAGEVVGINTAIATVASGASSSQSQSGNIGVGFAVPANTVDRIAKEIIDTGKATHAFLGVTARTAADDRNANVGTGAEIGTVEPGTAAADGGLQVGDVVTAVGDRQVTTSTELTAAVRSQAPGEKVQLTIRRGDQTSTVEVTLGSTS